jgi:hypothetical protein
MAEEGAHQVLRGGITGEGSNSFLGLDSELRILQIGVRDGKLHGSGPRD